MPRIRAVFLLLALAAGARAEPTANYFVAPNGNDAWSGTLAAPNAAKTDGPFATPGRARDAVRELRRMKPKGLVTVLIRGGRYELREPLTFTADDSGTADSPTRFAAYPGETPILSGGVRVGGWKPAANGNWVADLPAGVGTFRHISVNGEFRHRPRLPREGFYTVAGLAGADPKGKYNTPADRFEFADGQINAGWKNLTEVEVVVLHFWVDVHLKITGVDPAKSVVRFDRFSKRHFTDDYQNRLARYYVSNVFEALGPGEFYHGHPAGKLHYRLRPGEDVAKLEIVVPRLTQAVRFHGAQRVELHGLTVADTTWEPPAKDAVDAQAASIVPGAVSFQAARHCSFENGRVVNVGGYGVELLDGSRQNRIVGNEIALCGAGGVRMTGGGAGSPAESRTGENVITDNHLHDLGELFHSGVGVLSMHADRNTISHNHIHRLYYTGISVGWVWGYGPSVSVENRIEHNHIHDVGRRLLSDMGGVYLLGIAPGTVVRGNVIHDIDAWTYGGWGIYTDEGSTGVLVEGNLVYRTKTGGFHQHYGKDNLVRNNIFALARLAQVERSRMEPHVSFRFERNLVYYRDGKLFDKSWTDDKFVLDHNVYWNAAGPVTFPGGLTFAQWQARGFDKDSLVADPLFVDPDKGDFRLKPGSPAEKVGFQPLDVSQVGPRPKDQRK
jgi:hypothetical protein